MNNDSITVTTSIIDDGENVTQYSSTDMNHSKSSVIHDKPVGVIGRGEERESVQATSKGDVAESSGVERPIIIRSKRGKRCISELDGNVLEIDCTSKANGSSAEFIRLSPFTAFYTADGRPGFEVPFHPDNYRSYSVEGIWQGLKAIGKDASSGVIDASKFRVTDGVKIKRKAVGKKVVLGHYGGEGRPLLSYLDARQQIYIPVYNYMLDTYAREEVIRLYNLHLTHDLVLVDYFANGDVMNEKTPLSHASLVKSRLQEMFKTQRGKPIETI